MIDDMETGLGFVRANCRIGPWYTFNDATPAATQTPVPNTTFAPAALTVARAGSTYAARTVASGFLSYAGMGKPHSQNDQ